MKKVSFIFFTLLTVIAVSCSDGNSDAVSEKGKFITASVTRGGDNARVIEWNVNAAEGVDFLAETQGEKSMVAITLKGKTEQKVEGEVQPLVLKLTAQNREDEMPHEFTATDESMTALKEAVKAEPGKEVEVTFKGEMKATDVPKMNNSKYFLNVVMP